MYAVQLIERGPSGQDLENLSRLGNPPSSHLICEADMCFKNHVTQTPRMASVGSLCRRPYWGRDIFSTSSAHRPSRS